MVNLSLELEGVEALEARLEELEERFDGDAVWVTGTNVEYGVFLEMGTRHMPPYPWFRPAIREFKANPEQFLRETTEFDSIDAIPTTNALVEAVAAGLSNRMTDNVNAQDASATRSPGTDPLHPRRQTGNLSGDIKAIRVR